MDKRLNKARSYFPCHKGLEDYAFCYCPFYPCLDKNFGRYVYSRKLKKNIWSCQNCSWIHKRKVVNNIFALIRENRHRINNETLLSRAEGQKLKPKETGIIILGHGSKLKKANSIVPEIIETIKRRLRLSFIMPAYLQFCQPDLGKSIKNLASKGCKRIIIVPFFLFAGNHVRRDIPSAIKKESARYPEVNFIYTKNLGEDVRLSEIVLDRIKEAAVDVCDE